MSRLSLIVLASVLVLGGCDSAADSPAQPAAQQGGDLPPPPPQLPGQPVRAFAGTPLPDLAFADAAGRTLDLGAQDGPVLINLWATWCGPCVVEMPQLDALAAELEGEVRVITVSQDLRGAEVVTPFFAQRGFQRLEPWLDPDAELSALFTPEGLLPLTILFDAQGKEVLRVAGGYEWGSADAAAMIRAGLSAQ